ncbi:PRD domain-containing protein [Paenibacillus frigoriresistens]|uniref:BglG family transcription antiterminator n=1 Tax=Paenibacillus alginolyticus TaxID=59839 RepID=UPI0015665E3A|nr:PRD domain-containing protein [Paenibacillus frigoriresistens]NRF95847.1 PRD domain-containing protein [Paenibacillus frigoriresistens]
MALSVRSRGLLKKLLLSPSPLRIKDFARQYEVSERTIKYDLEFIRMWLQEQGVEMKSKPSAGISIECGEAIRRELLEKMEEPGIHVTVNQQERVRHIILDLLLTDMHMTIGDLVKKLDVSRNTILSDLVIAEAFFKEWHFRLERSRFGIQIIGPEKQRRSVLEKVVHDMLDGNDMLQIVQGVVQRQKPSLHFSKVLERFLEPVQDLDKMFEAIAQIVRETEGQLGVLLSDRVIIGVFVRLCIIIQRHHQLSEHRFDVTGKTTQYSEHSLQIYAIFRQVLMQFSEHLGLAISEADAWFISLQAIGMATPFPAPAGLEEEPQPDVYAVTMELIRHVSSQMRFPFQEDPDLFQNLLSHMSDKLMKCRHGVAEPNPLLKEIKHAYKSMFHHVKLACTEVLGKHNINLTDADIGFIVLHFQNTYERKAEMQKWRALVVCGTGRGTSKLLMTVLENEIKHLQFVASCSVMDVDKVLELVQVDLVISILPVRAKVPVVVVGPIPGKADFQAIQAQLIQLGQRKVQTRDSAGTYPVQAFPQNSAQLESKVQEIIYKGYEFSREIISRFSAYLSDERAEGLTLHLLFMANRIAFGTAYTSYESPPVMEGPAAALKEELKDVLSTRNVSVTEGELLAILRYFEEVDKGAET